MKTKFIILFMLLCALLITTLSLSCNSDDDNDDESDNWDDDDSDEFDDDSDSSEYPGCENTNRPELLGVVLLVNNQETTMSATVYTSDQVAIAFEYNDEDCNFVRENWGARARLQLNQTDRFNLFMTTGEMASDVWVTIQDANECSSAQMGGPYVLEFNPGIFLLPDGFEREFPYVFGISDGCGFDSLANNDFDFTVVEE